MTSRYHGNKISGSRNMELKQQGRQRQRKRQKSNRLILAKKKNFARASRFFVHVLEFLDVVPRFLISCVLFME